MKTPQRALALLASALMLGAGQPPATPAAQPPSKADPVKKPAANSAIAPAPRDKEDWWTQRHAAALERNKQHDVGLLFIGDSITQGWEDNGKAEWEKRYTPRKAENLGFSGDRTQHVLWRLQHGEVDGVKPKAAVIMIGTNNSNGTDNTAAEIAEGISAIVGELRHRLPETRILLLAIFPRGEHPDTQREKIADVNKRISTLADSKNVFYLDIGDRFVDKDGAISKDIMPDFLHLSPRGYEIWGAAIEDRLNELLK